MYSMKQLLMNIVKLAIIKTKDQNGDESGFKWN